MLEPLSFENRFTRELPGDPEATNFRRQVENACYSRVNPTPVAAPVLVAYAEEVAALLGLSPASCETAAFTSVFSGYQSRIVQILDLMHGAHDKRGIVYDFMSVIGEHVNATHIWLGTFYWSFKFSRADVARADTFVQKWTDTLFAGMDKQIKLLASTKAFQGIQDHVIRIGMGERMFVPTPYEEVEVE